jgi:hypothetical protein
MSKKLCCHSSPRGRGSKLPIKSFRFAQTRGRDVTTTTVLIIAPVGVWAYGLPRVVCVGLRKRRERIKVKMTATTAVTGEVGGGSVEMQRTGPRTRAGGGVHGIVD